MGAHAPTRVGLLACVVASLLPAVASAADVTPAVGATDGLPSSVSLQVLGRVQSRCGFRAGAEPQSPPTIEATGAAIAPVRIAFGLDCNDEFTIQVSSANGALRAQQDEAALARAIANGFRVEAPYSLSLDVPRGDAPALSERCSSAQLMSGAGCTMSSGAGQISEFPSMAGEAALTIEFPEAVSPGEYVAGRYRDVLTITVGTRS